MFLQNNVSPEAVCEAERKIFVMLYGGKNSDSLTYLRYIKYTKMPLSAANVKPESLPVTEQAAMFHIYGVYFQLHELEHTHGKYFGHKRVGLEIRRCFFGTSCKRSRPAPDELLKVMRCNCQATSKNLCSERQCSCRSNRLKCVAACGGCPGTECQNCVTV